MALPVLRSHPAERVDSAVPAAGARRRLLQHLPAALPGEPAHAARHCRAVSTLAERVVGETEHPGCGGSERPPRRLRRGLFPRSKPGPSRGHRQSARTSAHHDGDRRQQNQPLASSRSPTAGWFNTTSISTTGSGDGCSSASVPTFRSPPASASISIIGWRTAWVRKASPSSSAPMPSWDVPSPNASSNSPTRSPLGTC